MTASHTGSIAGSIAVYDGAFRQAGIIRVETSSRRRIILSPSRTCWFGQGIPKGQGSASLRDPEVRVLRLLTCAERWAWKFLPFSEETVRRLAEEIPGASRTNPTDIDLGAMAMLKGKNPFVVRANIIEMDENIDMLAFVGSEKTTPRRPWMRCWRSKPHARNRSSSSGLQPEKK